MKKHLKLLLTCTMISALLVGCGSSSTGSYDSSYNDSYSSSSTGVGVSGFEDMNISANTATTSGVGGFFNGSSSNKSESEAKPNYDYEKSETKAESIETEEQTESEMTLNMEKLVYKCKISIETMEYQKSYDAIKTALNEVGGIVQYERQTDDGSRWYYEDYVKHGGTLNATINCRIPTAKYDEFVNSISGVGKVMDKQTSVDNISQEYFDTTTKIESLKIQEQRLLTFLEQAETIEEMLEIEDRLESLRYEISKLETKVIYMDMDVAYSYVDISLEEVLEYSVVQEPVKKNTFIDRLVNTVKDSADDFLDLCEELLFAAIYLVPYALIGGIVFIVLCKVRKVKAKDFFKRKKNEEIKDLINKLDDITKQ